MSAETALLDLAMRVRMAGKRLDPTSRDGLNAALVRALSEIRHGAAAEPAIGPAAALDAFREITRLAVAAGAPRDKLVLIFNGEEDAAEAARRDLE